MTWIGLILSNKSVIAYSIPLTFRPRLTTHAKRPLNTRSGLTAQQVAAELPQTMLDLQAESRVEVWILRLLHIQ